MLKVRWLHRWLGLLAGVWLTWLGLTGSLLAVAPAWEESLHPAWYRVAKRPACALELRRQSVVQAFPGLAIRRWEPATAEDRSERVLVGKDLAVFLDPADGRILGSQPPSESLGGRVLKLHTLWEPALPYVALAVLLVLSSGWRLQPFRWRQWRQAWRAQPLDWHRRLGWISVVPLLVSLFTGAALVEYKLLDRWLRGSAPPAAPVVLGQAVNDLDALVNAAAAVVPGARHVRWEFPSRAGEPFVARLCQPGELNPKGRTFVHLDPATAAVVLVENPLLDRAAVRILQGAYRLHAGYYPGGFLLFIVGLCPAALWWSGWIMRRRRIKAQTGLR